MQPRKVFDLTLQNCRVSAIGNDKETISKFSAGVNDILFTWLNPTRRFQFFSFVIDSFTLVKPSERHNDVFF